MGLTRLAINRPLAMLMFICSLVIMGFVSLSLMKVDRLPNISFPFVSVNVGYPGASPLDVEALVSKPIEGGMAGIAGIQSIESNSNEGRGNVSLRLVEGADAQLAAIDAERRMASIRGRLPTDINPPTVNRADPSSFPIMNVALYGKRPIEQIFDIAVNQVQPKLQSVLGVADATIQGGIQKEIQIRFDFQKLDAYGLSVQQVQTAIARENIGQPVGTLQQARQNINIRSMGALQNVEEIANAQITTGAAQIVRVRDVAEVVETNKDIARSLRLNGQDAVGFSITKQSDANALTVADDLKKTIAELGEVLPADVQMRITNDTSRFTRSSLNAVQFDLGIAIFLTATVLMLFLHSWRNVVIVVLAIPTSLVSTFVVMYAMGFSLNMMSLMALALLIGILVDDSIVVLENIHRHIQLGEPVRSAALTGRSEIGMAAIAITLADVIVYMPVAFMAGNLGKLFREYGLTIAVATLFSLFIGFTLTPMLASRWLKDREEHDEAKRGPWNWFVQRWEVGIEGLGRGYRGLLSISLDHRPVVVLIGVSSVAVVAWMYTARVIGFEYVPNEDDGNFRINIIMPSGSSFQVADNITRQVEEIVRANVPEMEAMYASGGGGFFGGGGFAGGGGNIDVQVTSKGHPWWIRPWEPVVAWWNGEEIHEPRKRSTFDIVSDLRRRVSGQLPEANVSFSFNSAFVGGGGSGLNVRLLGDDLETLQRLATQVEGVMRQTAGVADVRNNATAQLPEIRLTFDRDRMAELGVTTQQVATQMRIAVAGVVVGQLRPEGKDQLDMTLVAESADRLDLDSLINLPITSQIGVGGGAAVAVPVRLGQIATIERGSGPSQIQRVDRRRQVNLNGQIAQGATIGDVARVFRENMAAEMTLPAGYRWELAGQAQQLDVATKALGSALLLSVLLIYMLLVALYESWLDPLAIMFALPVSLIGAFGGLWVTGNTFNIFSMIGMIMLMGLAAKNGILLVDFTKTLRARGMDRREAIETAGPTRLRPIIMTTATIVFAMLPLAAKLEEGAESRAPMAVVVIGGVLSSTLLTLVFVPVVYSYLDDLQAFFSRRGIRGPKAPSGRRPIEEEALAPVPVAAAPANGHGTPAHEPRVPVGGSAGEGAGTG